MENGFERLAIPLCVSMAQKQDGGLSKEVAGMCRWIRRIAW